MTRGEAVERCAELAAEHEDRHTHRWVPRRAVDGDWEVVKIKVPAELVRGMLKETVSTKPKPPEPDDPRSSFSRNLGGGYG